MQSELRRTFASLAVRNFRLYFIGQGVSLCGTWMQMVGLSWLVLQLTHSGTQLGLVTAAQFLPILVLGIFGGVIVDRFNKRRILYTTQALMGMLALLLGLLVLSGHIQLWMVYTIALGLGLVTVVDAPARQSFVFEMVGGERLRNAVTLNSTIANSARVIGPSIAAALIATVGIGMCFVLNAASYLAVLTALWLMDGSKLQTLKRAAVPEPNQVKAGLSYAWHTPTLRATLLMMLIVGTFTYEFPVILPLFSTTTLHGGAGTYSALTAAMGIGAVVGGLYSAGRGAPTQRLLVLTALAFGISILIATLMPGIRTSLLMFVVVGGLSVLFISLANTTLQLTSTPNMRGRVMSLWSITFQGTTPIGGPIVGAIADHSNPRIGLAVGGAAAIVAALIGSTALKTATHRYTEQSAHNLENVA